MGLFLGALMDRWIDIVMSARRPVIVTYFDDRARYGICFGLLYFLLGAVAVDLVLQKYWPLASALPDRKITDMSVYNELKSNQKRFVLRAVTIMSCANLFQSSQHVLSPRFGRAFVLFSHHLRRHDHLHMGLCDQPSIHRPLFSVCFGIHGSVSVSGKKYDIAAAPSNTNTFFSSTDALLRTPKRM